MLQCIKHTGHYLVKRCYLCRKMDSNAKYVSVKGWICTECGKKNANKLRKEVAI